jgi:uncharacterized membrane protein YphA (DoxX/SURF4 family)
MQTQYAGNHKPSFLAKVAAATRPIPKLWTLFGGIAWPYIELAIRLWIAKLFSFFGFMQMLHWETTLAVASQENPIPLLAPHSAAFLSTAIYIVCAALLGIGFMTRYAAVVDHATSLHLIRYPALLDSIGRLVCDLRCGTDFGR